MSVFILLSYALLSPSSATPLPSSVESAGATSEGPGATAALAVDHLVSDPTPHLDQFVTRTFLTCLSTVVACLWVSVHPNAPSPLDSAWKKLLRRIRVVIWALFVPELMVAWSVRQWVGARNLKERYRVYKWSMAHAHFLQMGGWVLVRPWPSVHNATLFHNPNVPVPRPGTPDDPLSSAFLPRQVLSPLLLDKLLSMHPKPFKVHKITPPLHYIRAHGTPDLLITSFAVLQTTWFVVQVLAKAISHIEGNHVRVLRIELVTASYIVMSLIMYVLWWDKPMDVRTLREIKLKLERDRELKKRWTYMAELRSRPRPIYLQKTDEEDDPQGEEVEEEEEEQGNQDELPFRDHWPMVSTLSLRHNPSADPPVIREPSISRSAVEASDAPPTLPELPRTSTLSHQAIDTEESVFVRSHEDTTPRSNQDTSHIPYTPTHVKPDMADVDADSNVSNKTIPSTANNDMTIKPLPQVNATNAATPNVETPELNPYILPLASPSPQFASGSTPSFRTADQSHHEDIEEVPRSRASSPSTGSPRSMASTYYPTNRPIRRSITPISYSSSNSTGPARPPPQHEDVTCHPTPGVHLFQNRRRYFRSAGGHDHIGSRPPSVISAVSYSADSTIFETIWSSVGSSYFAERTGLDWFFGRCMDIMIGKWSDRGYRNAVEQEDKHLGRLWLPELFTPEMIDCHEKVVDKTLHAAYVVELGRFKKRVALLHSRVPTFYATASASTQDDRNFKLIAGGLGMLFGIIHLIGWNFPWRGDSQQVLNSLWRASALAATITPIFAALAMLRLSEEHGGPAELSIQYMLLEIMAFPLTLLYIPARLMLLTLSILEVARIGRHWDVIVELSAGAVGEWGEAGTLRWTRFIPHFQ